MSKFGPSDWMKKAKVVVYTRISDRQQAKDDRKKSEAKEKPALIQQFNYVKRELKANKLPTPKKEDWYAEVGSGTNKERPQYKALIARAAEESLRGKRVFIAVQDPSRWSRNIRHSFAAIDRLHDLGIPILALREGIQTGSVGDLHPPEEALFVNLQGGASFVSQEQKKKADQAVQETKDAGVMSSKGRSLFPFARIDPLDAYEQQLPLVGVPKNEGGGVTAFRGTVEGMTAPRGISQAGVIRFGDDYERIKKVLTAEEFEQWRQYRSKIRDLLKEIGYDPYERPTPIGREDFKATALMRMVGRYLQEPEKYTQRTDEEIKEILENPKDFLGTKALMRYVAQVGKR